MCFVKKVFLKISQNSHENTCARLSFLIKLQDNYNKICETFENTYFEEHLRTTASAYYWIIISYIEFSFGYILKGSFLETFKHSLFKEHTQRIEEQILVNVVRKTR